MSRKFRLPTLFAASVIVSFASIAPAAAETPVSRGAYLVNSVGACGNCHAKDTAGHVPGGELSGGFNFQEEFGLVIGPNITPDVKTGIGGWTDAQIVTALRDGLRPNGTLIGPPMPSVVYRQLSDKDSAAIVAYLRSIKPIDHLVARTEYKMQLPPSYGPPVTHVPEPIRGDTAAYGAYLATFGHCVLCHTAPAKDGPFDMSRAFAGGREIADFRKSGTYVLSRNITSDPDDGIGKWSKEQIKKTIVTGIRPDGTKLAPTMPFAWYAKMTPSDLDAIVLFLRTLPPIKNAPH